MSAVLAFLKGLPDLVKLIRDILSLFGVAASWLKVEAEEKKENNTVKDLKTVLKEASKLPADKKRELLRRLKDGMSGNSD